MPRPVLLEPVSTIHLIHSWFGQLFKQPTIEQFLQEKKIKKTRKGKNGTKNDIVYWWCGSLQCYIIKIVGAFIQHSECEDKEELGILGVSERASQPNGQTKQTRRTI